MSKYIKLFKEHETYDEFAHSEDLVFPNTSLCLDESCNHYNPKRNNWFKYKSSNGIIGYGGYGINEKVFNAHIVDTLYDEETGVVTIIFDDNITSLCSPTNETRIAGDYAYNILDVEMPDVVTCLGDFLFQSTSLTSFKVERHVKHVGLNILLGIKNLASIVVEEGNVNYDSRNNCNAIIETATNTLISGCKNTIIPEGVTKIGESAFQYCNDLTEVIMPNSVMSISKNAFFSSGLTNLVLSDKLITIEDDAFAYCRNITNVVLPNTLRTIGKYAFINCLGLTDLVIPDNVTDIAENAFNGCGFSSLTIGSGITSIKEGTFRNCTKLRSVTIPSNVTEIYDYAFAYCSLLSSVTIESTTPPTLYKVSGTYQAFYNNASGRLFYVPAESVDTYKTTAGWSTYASYIRAIPNS